MTAGRARQLAALEEHRPGEFPCPAYVGRSPIMRVRGIVESIYGQAAAGGVEGLLRPGPTIARAAARRILDATLPTTRPVQLDLPDATTPNALDLSFSRIR